MNKVAVIMSVYKKEVPDFFNIALQSICSQTLNVDLYIYIDGDVPQNLTDILSEYSSRDNVFVYKSDTFESRGLARALNYLIDIIEFKNYSFIARMDTDDISYPDRIEKQVDFMERNLSVDVLGTSCREFGASYALDEKHLPQTHNELVNFSIARCPFIHPTVMFRTSVFITGHRYPEDTVLTEDMAFWFQLLNSGFKFSNMNTVLLDYRLSENTIFRRKGWNKAISEIGIRTKNMFYLNQFTLKNCLLISSRMIFHLMPGFLIKLAYKKAR